jgi:predicted membrane protein (TIGR00267 family)
LARPSLLALFQALMGLYREIAHYASILNAKDIARRMFVTNSFDGLLSSLGVVLGNYLSGTTSLESYIGAVLGASFSLGFFSGVVATYLSERAERLRELRKTERVMLHSLKGTIYEKAAKLVPIYVAFWSGLGAIVLPIIGISPFLLARLAGVAASIALLVYSSAAVMVLELFGLGYYLGGISGENRLLSGLRMAMIGLGSVAFFTLIHVAG